MWLRVFYKVDICFCSVVFFVLDRETTFICSKTFAFVFLISWNSVLKVESSSVNQNALN